MDLSSRTSELVEIDAICDRYERAFRQGKLPEDFDSGLSEWLARIGPHSRALLRKELHALWLELSRQSGVHGQDGTTPREDAATGSDELAAALKWISSFPTFDPLSASAKQALASQLEPRKHPATSFLLRAGSRADGLYLITSGRAEVIVNDQDDRKRIDFTGPGSVVGEMSLITGHPCSADVIALTDVRSRFLCRSSLELLRECYPEIEICLSQLTSDRLGSRTVDALCGKSFGGYRLMRCIGRGAMGVVYEAEREEDRNRVAVKMLRHRFIDDVKAIRRFNQEGELMRRLQHPNIASTRDHFVAYRTRFIVMDLCDGSDLSKHLRHDGRLRPQQAMAVIGQLARGVQCAHDRGVLHLDLKPANLLVDRDGTIRITDFGLARLIDATAEHRSLSGTPPYMSPERFLSGRVSPAADWYSVGCIAFELLTGYRLFSQRDTERMMQLKLRGAEEQLEDIDPHSPLRPFMLSALQSLEEDRQIEIETIKSWARPVPELVDPSGGAMK